MAHPGFLEFDEGSAAAGLDALDGYGVGIDVPSGLSYGVAVWVCHGRTSLCKFVGRYVWCGVTPGLFIEAESIVLNGDVVQVAGLELVSLLQVVYMECPPGFKYLNGCVLSVSLLPVFRYVR